MAMRASAEAGDVYGFRPPGGEAVAAASADAALANDIQMQRLQTDLDDLVRRAGELERLATAERNKHPGVNDPDLDKAEIAAKDMRALSEQVNLELAAAKNDPKSGKKKLTVQKATELTGKIEHELHQSETHFVALSEKPHDSAKPLERPITVHTSPPAKPFRLGGVEKAVPAAAVLKQVKPTKVKRAPHTFDIGHKIEVMRHGLETRVHELTQSAPQYIAAATASISKSVQQITHDYVVVPAQKLKAATQIHVIEPIVSAANSVINAGKSGLALVAAGPRKLSQTVAGFFSSEKKSTETSKPILVVVKPIQPTQSNSLMDALAKTPGVHLSFSFVEQQVDELMHLAAQPFRGALSTLSHLNPLH